MLPANLNLQRSLINFLFTPCRCVVLHLSWTLFRRNRDQNHWLWLPQGALAVVHDLLLLPSAIDCIEANTVLFLLQWRLSRWNLYDLAITVLALITLIPRFLGHQVTMSMEASHP